MTLHIPRRGCLNTWLTADDLGRFNGVIVVCHACLCCAHVDGERFVASSGLSGDAAAAAFISTPGARRGACTTASVVGDHAIES